MSAIYENRPFYSKAHAALQAAHDACFGHPDRPALGMSRGPFAGVNEALGIIATLERTVKEQASIIEAQRALLSKVEA